MVGRRRAGPFRALRRRSAAELTVRAWLGNSWASGDHRTSGGGHHQPLALKISPIAPATLQGRVLDRGAADPGLDCAIWRLARGNDRRVIDLEPIMSVDGRVVVRTDSRGLLPGTQEGSPPRRVLRRGEHPGRLSNRSRAVGWSVNGTSFPRRAPRVRRSPAWWSIARASPWPVPWSSKRVMAQCRPRHHGRPGTIPLRGVLEGPVILVVRKVGYQSQPHLLDSGLPASQGCPGSRR